MGPFGYRARLLLSGSTDGRSPTSGAFPLLSAPAYRRPDSNGPTAGETSRPHAPRPSAYHDTFVPRREGSCQATHAEPATTLAKRPATQTAGARACLGGYGHRRGTERHGARNEHDCLNDSVTPRKGLFANKGAARQRACGGPLSGDVQWGVRNETRARRRLAVTHIATKLRPPPAPTGGGLLGTFQLGGRNVPHSTRRTNKEMGVLHG